MALTTVASSGALATSSSGALNAGVPTPRYPRYGIQTRGVQQRLLPRAKVSVSAGNVNKVHVRADTDGSITFSFADTTQTSEYMLIPESVSHGEPVAEDAASVRYASERPAGKAPISSFAEDHTRSSVSNIPIPVLNYRHREVCEPLAPAATVKQEKPDPFIQYKQACKRGDLQAALSAVEMASQSRNMAALASFIHKNFLRLAGEQQAVAEAFQFVQLLPHGMVDGRTYNMLITVCAQSADLTSALKAASLLQSSGLKLDRTHYTNLIKTAAAAADADAAFKLYSEMQKEGITPCAMSITTLIDACAREIMKRTGVSPDRRAQIVLAERAFQVFTDGMGVGVTADVAMWNALLNVAGYSGKIDQALGVMEKMQISGVKPNDRTYSTLIAACNRAGQPDMGLKVFDQAMKRGVSNSLMVYVAALEACSSMKPEPNVDVAMAIYAELKDNNVLPSTQFYSALVSIAGHSGCLGLALNLQDDMRMRGIAPDDSFYAAMINACMHNNALQTAEEIYADVRTLKGRRTPHSFNTMINAYAQVFNIGNAVMVVEDMVAIGVDPDRHTYGTLMKACQRCGEPDLAFLIHRLMRNQGFSLDEAAAFTLVRASFNHIRSLWRPGGYPPTRDGYRSMLGTTPAAAALLKALNCPPQAIAAWRDRPEMALDDWQKRAINIYREFISSGHVFSIRMLNITLASLRLPLPQNTPLMASHSGMLGLMQLSGAHSFDARAAFSHGGGLHFPGEATNSQVGSSEAKRIKTIEIQFDSRAVSLIEEAISSGHLPPFSLSREDRCLVNLCGMPPTVAEVYVLTMFRSLERRGSARYRHKEELTILVPPFNPTVLFVPSHDESERARADREDPQKTGLHRNDADHVSQRPSDHAVGLAVAAQLRRLKIFSYSVPTEGLITVRGKEITRWVRSRIRSTMNQKSTLVNGVSGMQPSRSLGSLSDQQRRIRVDLASNEPGREM